MPIARAYVDVEVTLEDYDSEDLVEELRKRGDFPNKYDFETLAECLEELYQLKRYAPEKFDAAFSILCWEVLGKNV